MSAPPSSSSTRDAARNYTDRQQLSKSVVAVPLSGSASSVIALDARVLVEERVARARARYGSAHPDALVTRAQVALGERAPLPEGPVAIMRRQNVTAHQLLEKGYTFYELLVSGADVSAMLCHLTLDDLHTLGATYEGMVRGNVRAAVEQRAVALDRFCALFNTTLVTLMRDRVIASPGVLAALRPTATQLRQLGVTAQSLIEQGMCTLDELAAFQFTFDEWTHVLALQPWHLAHVGFDMFQDAEQLGWSMDRVATFVASV